MDASYPYAPRSIFVTGSTGFVGTHLCRVLTERGWQVQASIRADGAALDLAGVGSARLELFREPMRWQEAMRGCQGVVHLAARVHQMHADARIESEYDRVNVEGSGFVAQQAMQAGVQRFVFLSSIKVNGEGADRPYRSGDAPQPRDAYGRSKWAAEQRLAELCANSRMGLAIIRPPLVYGPGVRANFHLLMRLADSGLPLPLASIANRRSFIGVSNLIDFIGICLTHPGFADTWLASDGEDLSTPDLLGRLANLMGRPARMFGLPPLWLRRLARPLGLSRTIERLSGTLQVDSSAARVRLGWKPPSTVDEELARTVAAYLAERTK